MGKEIVRYNSDLNKLTFAGFDDRELSLFFAIASKVKYKDAQEVTMSFDSLYSVIGKTEHNESSREFAYRIAKMNKKLLGLSFNYVDGSKLKGFNLFHSYEIDLMEKTLTVSVSKEFTYLFNKFIDMKSWTRFELEEFVSIKGKHPKNLYRLLKQWRTKGKYSVTIKEFQHLMNIETYSTREMTRRVIAPSIEKIRMCSGFKDIKYSYSYGTGHKPVRIVFEWTPINADLTDYHDRREEEATHPEPPEQQLSLFEMDPEEESDRDDILKDNDQDFNPEEWPF